VKTKPLLIFAALAAVIAIASTFFFRKPPETAGGGKPFRVGAIIALTGPNADYGLQVKRGIELAKRDIEARHPGFHLEVQYEDSATSPAKGLSAFQKLTDVDGHKVIVGNASFLAGALAPVASDKKTLFMALATTMPNLVENRPYVMRHFPTAPVTTKLVVDYAVPKFKRVAVAYVNDDYGKNAATVFRNQFEKDGRQVTHFDGFDAKSSEQRTLAAKMLEQSPDAVFVPGYGPGFIALLKHLRELNTSVPILGDLALVNANVLKAAGASAEGVILPAFHLDAGVAKTPEAKKFLERYQSEFGGTPDLFLTATYDCVLLLCEAARATDGTPEAIRNWLIAHNPHKTLEGTMNYSKDGDSELAVTLVEARGGKLVPHQ
jgi:branched-chain amino acid transport system substrate-binding protein